MLALYTVGFSYKRRLGLFKLTATHHKYLQIFLIGIYKAAPKTTVPINSGITLRHIAAKNWTLSENRIIWANEYPPLITAANVV